MVDRDPIVALRHGVEHGDDLVAEHLADDHPARVHPQRPADQFGHGNGAVALHVRQPLLERDHVGVQLGKVVQAQLQGPLHGDEPFLGRDLVRQRAQQGGLARVGRPGDHDVLPRGHRGREEGRHVGAERGVADQVGEEHFAHPGPPDGDRRPQGHIHDRGQPGAVGQAQVELRVGGVERPAGQARVGSQDLDQLDQLFVAFRDRLRHDLPAVGVADEDPVAPVDVDVLYLVVLEQWLKPAEPRRGQRGWPRPALPRPGRRAAAGPP